jgi:hypothetical protein
MERKAQTGFAGNVGECHLINRIEKSPIQEFRDLEIKGFNS